MERRGRRGSVLGVVGTAVLGAVLAACGGSGPLQPGGDGADPGSELTGRLDGWSGGAQPIELRVGTESKGRASLAEDGSFELPLPAPAEMEGGLATLTSAPCEGSEGTVSVTPAQGLRLAGPAYILVFQESSVPLGVLFQGFMAVEGDTVEAAVVDWFYADGPGTVTGRCRLEGEGGSLAVSYELVFEAGWNAVVTELAPTPVTSPDVELALRIGSAEQASWQFYPLPLADVPVEGETRPLSGAPMPFVR